MEDSQNEIVRKAISKALSDKVNLNDKLEKKELVARILADNKTFKKASVEATYSKFLKSEAEKAGQNPSDFKHGTMKPKFDESLNPKITNGKTVTVQNPLVKPNTNKDSELKTNVVMGDYSVSTCSSLGGMVYSGFSVSDEDMEDLTEQERKDIGEILKPLLDKFANGDRGTIIISIGALCGLFVAKKREARNKRKDRKALEDAKHNPLEQKEVKKDVK